MRVIYKGTVLTEKEKNEIWEILCQCDREFVPPLSARNSSSQKKLNLGIDENALDGEVPTTYFSEMIRQNFVLAYEETADSAINMAPDKETKAGESVCGRVIGFMTFKDHYMCDALTEFGESLYITTVCVRKELRGRGTLDAMYHCMETDAVQAWDCARISTRTWSKNAAHLHELEHRGYQLLAVLKDDRGIGLDTVYYGICQK